jgi:mannose-6-phosphate isomerase-like protein (cupin superfamily)
MILRVNDISAEELIKPKNGIGKATRIAYDKACEYSGDIQMFAVMSLDSDSTIGYHVHEDNMEIYLILDGKPVVNDNGTEEILNPGDMLITEKGQGHSMSNKTNDPVTFLAIIIK